MIYFVQEHCSEKFYEEDSEIIISEFNTIDSLEKRKIEVLFPESDDKRTLFSTDSFSNLDKVVYSFETENKLVNYGFYCQEDQSLFWESLFFAISFISERKSHKIKNIKMPISLFYSAINKTAHDSNFFTEIYEYLTSNLYNYYIYFVNFNEFIEFYRFFGNQPNKNFDYNTEILLTLAPRNELSNPLFIKGTELGIGETNLSSAEKWLEENLSLNKQETNNTTVYDEFLKKIKELGGDYNYYRKNLYNKAYNNNTVEKKYPDRCCWFIQGYPKYSTVLKCAKELSKDSLKQEFFRAFGYIYNEFGEQISRDLREFVKCKMNGKTRLAIVNLINTNENECKIKIKGYKKILERWKNEQNKRNKPRPFWTEEKFSSIIDNHKTRHCKKSIDRKLLFFLVFALDLNMSDAQKLFELSYCYLDKEGLYLLEDKILWKSLQFQQIYPNLKHTIFDTFIQQFATLQEVDW